MRAVFAAAMLALAAAPASAHDVHGGQANEVLGGRAVAVDGDTILLNGERIRLWGIEAPELSAPDGAGSQSQAPQ